MDNVILYNVTLTAEEVKSQYNKGVGFEGYPDPNPPCYENLIEDTDPLEFGLNETISLDAWDISDFTVSIELDGVNYTMNNVSQNYFHLWNPQYSGSIPYTIYLEDIRGNLRIIRGFIAVINSPLVIFSTITLVLLMGAMVLFYLKFKVWLVMLVILLFSFIFGVTSIGIYGFPFTPYFQIFFLIFQCNFFRIAKPFTHLLKKLHWKI